VTVLDRPLTRWLRPTRCETCKPNCLEYYLEKDLVAWNASLPAHDPARAMPAPDYQSCKMCVTAASHGVDDGALVAPARSDSAMVQH
jgi:hypothetical protein